MQRFIHPIIAAVNASLLDHCLDALVVHICLQNNAVWLSENGIIRKMLRANLHQRQYADLVGEY